MAVTVAIGVVRQRAQGGDDAPRGSEPGKGYHTLRSNYSSGLGGHDTSWKVPRDPQEYARRFVPAAKRQITDVKGKSE
nr:hypothetical protein [Lutimaribacter sp. EGI FJ00013]